MFVANNAFVINASMFGGSSAESEEFVRQQAASFDSANKHLVNSEVFQYALKMDEKFQGAALRSMIQEAIQATRVEARPDVIMRLTSLEELRNAQPVMQEYIMANPKIRKLFHRNQCDGYSDTYKDFQPGAIGWGHKPYEVVQSGVVEFTEEGYDIVCSSAAWESESREVIDQEQRSMIFATWRVAERIAKEGEEDLTNKYGGTL